MYDRDRGFINVRRIGQRTIMNKIWTYRSACSYRRSHVLACSQTGRNWVGSIGRDPPRFITGNGAADKGAPTPFYFCPFESDQPAAAASTTINIP